MTDIETVLQEIGEVALVEGVPTLLRSVADRYGLKTIAYLGTGSLDRKSPHREPFISVTYPPEWVERYRSQGYLNIDPVIRRGLRRLLPIDWDDFEDEGPAMRQFFGESIEFGLGRKGISFPVHGYLGDRALLSVTADFSDREWKWARRTAFRHFPLIASHLHDAVLRAEGISKALPHLSRRETECLRWTSEGKTVWECSAILGLSSHTVRCYLESARHKLNAASNTHAVSIALKSGLLFDLP